MRVMGTDAVVLVVEPTAAEVATVVALGAIEEIEAACSRFRPDSDLMRVNEAAGRAVPVGRCFIEALDVALDAARRTDGVVDPTIGGALRALGYDRDFASLERDGAPVVHLTRIAGWRAVEVDARRRTVRVPAGTSLDLGATAKALAADRAAPRGRCRHRRAGVGQHRRRSRRGRGLPRRWLARAGHRLAGQRARTRRVRPFGSRTVAWRPPR